jgi:hypothetical protein
VVPGQYVFADSSGAVLIPGGQIDELLAEAREVEAADAASRDQIARERARLNDHSASSPRTGSTRGAPFAWKQLQSRRSAQKHALAELRDIQAGFSATGPRERPIGRTCSVLAALEPLSA